MFGRVCLENTCVVFKKLLICTCFMCQVHQNETNTDSCSPDELHHLGLQQSVFCPDAMFMCELSSCCRFFCLLCISRENMDYWIILKTTTTATWPMNGKQLLNFQNKSEKNIPLEKSNADFILLTNSQNDESLNIFQWESIMCSPITQFASPAPRHTKRNSRVCGAAAEPRELVKSNIMHLSAV